jgi:hypothetical protein
MFIRVILSAVIYLAVFGTVGFADEVTCNSGARYEDNLDGTVFDCKSGLVWLKDANCMESSGGIDKESNGTLTWHKARKWAAGLNSGTIVIPGDWRLPTKVELMAMVESAKSHQPTPYTNPALTDESGTAQLASGCTTGCIFNNVMSAGGSYYWTSTPYTDDTSTAWYFKLDVGAGDYSYMSSGNYVWPVRGGQQGAFDKLVIQ